MEENTQKHHLQSGTVKVLIFWAVVTDLISLIPIVGDIVDPIYWWYATRRIKKDGVSPNKKAVRTRIIALIIKIIPVVQELPATLVGIITMIATIRAEEKLHPQGSEAVSADEPFNQDGVRPPQASKARMSVMSDADAQPLNIDGVRRPAKPAEDEEDNNRESPYGLQKGPLAA